MYEAEVDFSFHACVGESMLGRADSRGCHAPGLAGILILIVPRLLNYIIAIYLVLVGLVGIFGR